MMLPTLMMISAVSALTAVQVLGSSPDLSTLFALASRLPDVVALLSQNVTSFTLFAPTDMAFNQLNVSNPAFFAVAVGNNKTLQGALLYHALIGTVFQPSASPGLNFVQTAIKLPVGTSVQGANVNIISGLGSTASVTASTNFTNGDSNGVIHFIDHVLIPPQSLGITVNTLGLKGIGAALTVASISPSDSLFNGSTTFLPSDDAFTAFTSIAAASGLTANATTIAAVLSLHVASGVHYSPEFVANKTGTLTTRSPQTLTFSADMTGVNITAPKSSARVVMANILYDVGVAHVIDKVLLPDFTKNTAPTTAAPTSAGFKVASSSIFAALALVMLVLA